MPVSPVSTIDLTIIAIYFFAMIAIGVVASRKVQSSEDFAVAGRRLNLPLLSGTLIASAIGASATFGKAGKAYEAGFVILLSSVAYMLGYLIFAWLAPKLREAKIDSIPECLERRFGGGMRKIAAIVLLTAVISAFGAQLIAFGLMASSLLGDLQFSYQQIVIVAAVVIVLYTLFGGLLAVAYTDLVQVIIMVLGIGLLLPICLTLDLPVEMTVQQAVTAPQENFWGGLDWTYLLAFIPTYLAFVLIDPGVWQRAAGARKTSDLKPAMLTTSLVYGIWSVLVITLGVVAFNLYPTLATSDQALPVLLMNHLPPVAKGLCLAAVMAIMMSTADTVLLISGTTVSNDLVKHFKPNIQDKTLLKITRLTIVIVGIAGCLFALEQAPIFDVMMLSLAIFVSGLFVPVMAALFWKKASRSAAIASALAGFGSEILFYTLRSHGIFDIGFEPILLAVTVSAVTMWAVSLVNLRIAGRQPTPQLI
ncbi:sodium:solute symporter family protein [Microbulbifer agarilyticus]